MDSRGKREKGKEAGPQNDSVIPKEMRQREESYRLLKQKIAELECVKCQRFDICEHSFGGDCPEQRDPEEMPDRSELGEAD